MQISYCGKSFVDIGLVLGGKMHKPKDQDLIVLATKKGRRILRPKIPQTQWFFI